MHINSLSRLRCIGVGLLLFFPYTSLNISSQNALTRSGKGIEYMLGFKSTFSNGKVPLWITANQYGLSSVKKNNGLMRIGLEKESSKDSLHNWRIGYIADVAIAYDYTSKAIIHQLAANIDYKKVRLSLGAKEEPMAMKNQELSSGSQTFGRNARPIPQIKLSLPEYLVITGKKHPWAAIKGFLSYGMFTDGNFQRSYVSPLDRYSRNVLYHSKAGYLRLGNEAKFPITFEGGLEMASQFGGTVYNFDPGNGELCAPIHMSHSIKDIFKITFGMGSDPTDGVYANALGNTVGSWLMRLSYKGKTWGASIYYDHYFEDHSQLFFEYGWLDGLLGVEFKMPKNRFISNIVYEFIKTTYQSGPLYHDKTEAIPDQISGNDKYYNHGLYAGWQHWGQAIGNPLFISPLYHKEDKLEFKYNRFKAHHIGLNGNPRNDLYCKLLYSFERNWGTYDSMLDKSITTQSLLLEAIYSPKKIGKLKTNGWSLGVSLGIDHGKLLGNNTGFELKIAKNGLLTR